MLVAALLAACSRSGSAPPAAQPAGRPVVVATTTTLAALVVPVAGDFASVHALVPVGVSPETYEPTPRDLVELSRATLVVENGAGLDGWLDKLIKSSATHARVLVLSAVITRPRDSTSAGSGTRPPPLNPHFWLDPNYAELYVAEIGRALAHADPAHATAYRANAAAEIGRLAKLDAFIRRRIATIPPNRRVMIAFHDAWYYFDKRYGIRDVGSIESSPGKEPSAADLAALIALAKSSGVRAIFAEPEFSPRLARQLAEGAGVKTVTDLYDDSLGATPDLATYGGMMRHNVETIVGALGS